MAVAVWYDPESHTLEAYETTYEDQTMLLIDEVLTIKDVYEELEEMLDGDAEYIVYIDKEGYHHNAIVHREHQPGKCDKASLVILDTESDLTNTTVSRFIKHLIEKG